MKILRSCDVVSLFLLILLQADISAAAAFNAAADSLRQNVSTVCQLRSVYIYIYIYILDKRAEHYLAKLASAKNTVKDNKKILRSLTVAEEQEKGTEARAHCALIGYIGEVTAESERQYEAYRSEIPDNAATLKQYAQFLESQGRFTKLNISERKYTANSGVNKVDTEINLAALPDSKTACSEQVEISHQQLTRWLDKNKLTKFPHGKIEAETAAKSGNPSRAHICQEGSNTNEYAGSSPQYTVHTKPGTLTKESVEELNIDSARDKFSPSTDTNPDERTDKEKA
uniref:Variant surface glycoprotein 1977 n=1 Tax=Trypanosoma brucei TaxID=5691 RepID=M4TCX3_9TRYP|nr:variant surface glycoprotein 1977 [Trypanosoma brucei]